MKQTPKEIQIVERMQPGVLTRDGFLGYDERHLHEIIETDELELKAQEITADELADRMQYFTDAAMDSYDGPVVIDEVYQVEYQTFRGKLVCPFMHGGGYRKGIIYFTNLKLNLQVQWTPLNIHLIREHHFFQGMGSKFRLDPKILKEVLF